MIETRFKDTEVGRIPEDWEIKKVQELTDIITGATPSTTIPQYWNGGSIRWMSSGELNYKFIYDVEGRITQLGYDNTGTQMLPKYCVLIGLAGQGKTRGTAAYNYVEICTNQSIAAILPNNDRFNSLYLYYYVDSQYKYLRTLSAGDGGRGGLNKKILLNLEIILPPQLSEQTRIATALSNIDALISELGKLIEKKRAIKQGAMQQLLTGKKRLKRVVVSNRFKHTEMGELPDDWEVCTIDDIAVITTGSQNTQDYVENGIYPFYVRSQQVERINKWIFDTEGVVTAGDGVGTGKVFHYVKGKFGLHQRCYLIHKFSSQMNARFFYWIFSSYFYERVHSMTAKSSVDSVRREMIADMHVPLPPLDEQIQIASVLTSMDNEISALEAKKAKYEQIKQGMMQQLLTGKIRLVETAVKTNATSANVHFRRSVLAAEIAERLYEEPTFGHVKMEKMLFLTERLCHIDIGSHYHRDAAGPYDNRALRSIDSQLRKQKWFDVKRTEKGNRYVPMQNCGKHKTYFDKYFSAVLPTFDKIIDTFKTQNTERCEIVATLYSAWEDLLHSNKSFTDADIVNEVLNNWHESKKRISQDRWLSAIQWMRENGFAPNVRNE